MNLDTQNLPPEVAAYIRSLEEKNQQLEKQLVKMQSLYSDQNKTTAFRQKYEVPLFFVFCVVFFSVLYGVLWRINCRVIAE